MGFDWVVHSFDECLKDWHVVRVIGRRSGGRRVRWPVAVGEFVIIIGDWGRRIGNVSFSRGYDLWGKWRKGKGN